MSTLPALPAGVVLRSLRAGDVPQLQAALAPDLADDYPGGGLWLAARLRAATTPGDDATVAVHAGTGTVYGLLIARRKPRGVKIGCLWVTAAHRGQGIGRALLNLAVRAFGAHRMYVTFDQRHAPVMGSLWATAGFVEAAALPGRYRAGAVELVWVRSGDPNPPIRALSLTRPWGQLLLTGGKNIENRSRRSHYRGLLVLHGAQSGTDLAAAFCRTRQLPVPPPPKDCPVGYLGVAHLVSVDCHHDVCAGACSPWAMADCWHWRVAFPTAFAEPIPGPGNVGLWIPPAEVVDAVVGVVGAVGAAH